nr:MAG TPA: hypothetical protein [Caudoviricetes sp.]
MRLTVDIRSNRIFQETSRTCENKASLSLTVLSKVTDATMASKS